MKKSRKSHNKRNRKSYARKMRNAPRKIRGLVFQRNEISRKLEKLETERAAKENELQRLTRLKTQYRDIQIREANDRWEYHQLRLTLI